jgi:ABC-type polysaccharide/polyol phosphate export permease
MKFNIKRIVYYLDLIVLLFLGLALLLASSFALFRDLSRKLKIILQTNTYCDCGVL